VSGSAIGAMLYSAKYIAPRVRAGVGSGRAQPPAEDPGWQGTRIYTHYGAFIWILAVKPLQSSETSALLHLRSNTPGDVSLQNPSGVP
jgi:hypothetical protein